MSRIERAEVFVAAPGRNFVTLRITTSDGVTGLGDATLNGRELAVASYLNDHVLPLFLGRDPARIEGMWQYLYRGPYWRRGPVTMTAISAVDTALWDIKGKVAGLPVYQLLGGRSRDGVLVYGHASGGDTPALIDDVARFRDEGYRAIRAQAAVPGVGGTYGVRKGSIYEPAATALPDEQPWDTEAYLRFAPTYLEAIRDAHGFDFHLLHDIHHRLTPIEAARFGKSVEHVNLFWAYLAQEDGAMVDVTRIDPSFGGAAGDIVSTPGDLNHFYSALVAGDVVPAAQLAEMQTTVPMPEGCPGDSYGLGIMKTTLSCGVVAWGHGGDIPGFSTRGGAIAGGRAVTIVTTAALPSYEAAMAVATAVDEALC